MKNSPIHQKRISYLVFLLFSVAFFNACKKEDLLKNTTELQKLSATETGKFVHTLVGSTFGYKDGDTSEAQFASLNGIAVAENGTIYVADEHRIRKIYNGKVTTFAGSAAGFADGNGENAKFKNITDIKICSNGNLFVCDQGNNLIRKVTPTGKVSTFAGIPGVSKIQDGTLETATFKSLKDLEIDEKGNFFLEDYYSIREITSDGVVKSLINYPPYTDEIGRGEAGPPYPHIAGMTYNKGKIYVAFYYEIPDVYSRIDVVDKNGKAIGEDAEGLNTIPGIIADMYIVNKHVYATCNPWFDFNSSSTSVIDINLERPIAFTRIAGLEDGYLDGPALSAKFGQLGGICFADNKFYLLDKQYTQHSPRVSNGKIRVLE